MPIEVSKTTFDLLTGLSDFLLLALALYTALAGILAYLTEADGTEESEYARIDKNQTAALLRARATLTSPLPLLIIVVATGIKLVFAIGGIIRTLT